MATMTQHAPGTFCWPELATSDQAGARSFYTILFGWVAREQDIGGGETYTMLYKGESTVGALHQMKPEAMQGMPPHWASYVSTANLDDSTAKAEKLGGKVVMKPFDVMDAGRMAVILDPTGAAFCLWQAKKHSGAGVLDETGALCWTELMTNDTDKAGAFYQELFGWGREAMPMGESAYTVFKRGKESAGGMMKITPEMGPVPPHWMVYFAVDHCDASTAKAKALGARVQVPPTDIPNVGRFAVLQDPQGAFFSILGPASPA